MPAPKKRKKEDTARSHLLDAGWWKKVFSRVLIGVPVVGLLAGAAIIAVYSQLAKQYDLAKLGEMPQRTVVLDANGQLIGRMSDLGSQPRRGHRQTGYALQVTRQEGLRQRTSADIAEAQSQDSHGARCLVA